MKMTDVNILIAIPAYGGALQSKTAASIIGLDRVFNQKHIGHVISFIHNESLITRARNRFANTAAFDTDSEGRKFTHLLFIDADIVFEPTDILKAISADKPICALPVARKEVKWPQIVEAVKLGVPAILLEQFATDPCLNSDKPVAVDGIQQIGQIGTGIMLINVQVFHAIANVHPDWKFRLYPREIEQEGGRDFGYDFFQTAIGPDGHYLSEDFFFVESARRLGFETYLLPQAITSHIGKFEYKTDLRLLAASGVGVSGRNITFDAAKAPTQ